MTVAGREALARRIRDRLGPPPSRDEWPPVSVVVLNRDGAPHLRRLLRGLRLATAYPAIELIVVDNDSHDESPAVLDQANQPHPVVVLEGARDWSFSDANNHAVDFASHETVLFLNNDIELFEPYWLHELVAGLDVPGTGAVGSTLLQGGSRAAAAPSGYAVQHRGVQYGVREGLPHAFNVGDGEDLAGFLASMGDRSYPGVTAAALLMRARDFLAVGGFTTGYRFGTEDQDLGLKLVDSGLAVVCSSRSILIHHESATLDTVDRAVVRDNRLGNRELLLERWGPQLTRELRRDRLAGGGFWAGKRPCHMALTVTSNDPDHGYGDWYTARELGNALEERGWRASYVERRNDAWYSLPPGVDYLLVLQDQFDITRVPGVRTVAWVRNWTERWVSHPWFEEFDVVIASSQRSAEIIRETTGRHAPVIPLAANPSRFAPGEPDPEREADYVFTGHRWVERQLERAIVPKPDERVRILGKGWEESPSLADYAEGQVPYEELPAIYRSAKVVIDDTAPPTLPYDAVNCRVFDALAAGTVVVTNCERGVRELFDDEFPVWTSAESLRDQLDKLLKDDEAREAMARRYRTMVLERHTYSRRAEEITTLLEERCGRLRFAIKVGAPNWTVAPQWGDLAFARGLRVELERRGHDCRIQILPEWDDLDGLTYDVALHLKGLSEYTPKPGQFNVLWCISHPDELSIDECDRADLVLVASERFAAHLASRTETPVHVLEQATDPSTFKPTPDSAYESELCFVGNSRRVKRRILGELLPTGHDLAVWGADWEGLIDSRYVRGEALPSADVARAYSSAALVLNDHWDDMREHGFVSNRIYDALACGAVVVSDHLPELERFGDAVVTYGTRDELRRIVEHLLRNPEERQQRASGAREAIVAEHTFSHRVDHILAMVAEQMSEVGFATSIGANGPRGSSQEQLAASGVAARKPA